LGFDTSTLPLLLLFEGGGRITVAYALAAAVDEGQVGITKCLCSSYIGISLVNERGQFEISTLGPATLYGCGSRTSLKQTKQIRLVPTFALK
jgi:hypothetical protein